MGVVRTDAIIFDFDGTLVDNMHIHIEAWIGLSEDNGGDLTVDKYYASGVGGKIEDAIRHFYGKHLDDREVEVLAAQKEFLYRYLAKRELKPIAGSVEFLRALKAQGIPLAIATSADHRNADFQIDVLGLHGLFDVIVASEEVSVGKPDPEIFLLTATKLGVPPERCLVFEDSKPGLAAAHAAGMPIIGVATTYSTWLIEDMPGVEFAIEDFTDSRLSAIVSAERPKAFV